MSWLLDTKYLLGVLGLIVGIISTWVAFHYGRSRKPLYSIRHTRLGLVSHPSLHVRFGNKKVDRLSLVRFVFWNSGKHEIRREDIPNPPAGPRVVIAEDTKILDHKIVSINGDESVRLIPIDDHILRLDFEFLNRRDALLGEILCDDTTQTDHAAKIEGTIKGAVLQKGEIHNLSQFDNVFFIAAFLAFIGFSIVGTVSTVQLFMNGNIVGGGMMTILTLVMMSMTYLIFQKNVLNIPNKTPIEYDKFLYSGELPSGCKGAWMRNGA